MKTKCPFCQSENCFKEFKVKSYEVFKCQNCQLTYLNPQLRKNELKKYYSSDYYSYEPRLFEKILNFFANKSFMWEISHFVEKGKVLDIGCGKGDWLYLLKKNGWQTYGVDTSLQAVEIAKNKLKQDIYNCSIDKCRFEGNFFDLIILSHVLEHVKDPLALLKEAQRILKKNGIIFLEVPVLDRIIFKLTGKNYYIFDDVPGHRYFFTHNTLTAFLKKAGLSIVGEGITFFSPPFSLINGVLKDVKSKGCWIILFPLLLILTFPIKIFNLISGKTEIVRLYCRKTEIYVYF